MLRTPLRLLVGLTSALVLPSTMAAQMLGLPASYPVVMRGVGTELNVGGDRFGLRTIAATGIVALGRLTLDDDSLPLLNVSATVATISKDSAEAAGSAYGVDVSLLSSFELGVDHSTRGDIRRTHIPLAAALPLFGCGNARRIVELYGVPVWNVERLATPGGAAWRHPWGSGSLVAVLELHSGLGFQLGVQGPFKRASAEPYRRWIVGLGMHFSRHGVLESVPASQKRGVCAFAL